MGYEVEASPKELNLPGPTRLLASKLIKTDDCGVPGDGRLLGLSAVSLAEQGGEQNARAGSAAALWASSPATSEIRGKDDEAGASQREVSSLSRASPRKEDALASDTYVGALAGTGELEEVATSDCLESATGLAGREVQLSVQGGSGLKVPGPEEDAGRARTWVGRQGGEAMNNVTDKIYQLQQEVELWASRAWSSPALGLPLASSERLWPATSSLSRDPVTHPTSSAAQHDLPSPAPEDATIGRQEHAQVRAGACGLGNGHIANLELGLVGTGEDQVEQIKLVGGADTELSLKVQASMLQDCISLAGQLYKRSDMSRTVLDRAGPRDPMRDTQGRRYSQMLNSKTTLGIILQGTRIECVLIGGPAHMSKQVLVHTHTYTHTHTHTHTCTHAHTNMHARTHARCLDDN